MGRGRLSVFELDGAGCVLHRDDEARAALVLPGAVRHAGRLGGSPARPDLHYARKVLRTRGLAVLEVWWDFADAPEDGWEEWAAERARAALERLEPELAIVVARSAGSAALARLRERATAVPAVWVAPLLVREDVRAAIGDGDLVVAGAADELASPCLADARATGAHVVELPNANHALEVPDPGESVRILERVVGELDRFVASL